jgi:hypothetical protein
MPRPGWEVIPAEPFARWLNERVEYWVRCYGVEEGRRMGELADGITAGPCLRVVHECGWTADAGLRRLHRMRRQLREDRVGRQQRQGIKGTPVVGHTDWFERHTVEDALFHAGVPFGDLYPEIAAAEDVALEPDAWCPWCRATRTPIGGLCPWCEWRCGPPTGQVLRGYRLDRTTGKAVRA